MRNKLNKFLSGFQRITASGKLIPEIDGLRFLAIASVVLFHLKLYFSEKSNWGTVDTVLDQYPLWNRVLNNGHFGVDLFFAISGFILALPFAKHYLNNSKKPELKDYFLRRVTRLEPPYILILIILFLAHLFIVHKYTIQELIPSLAASLTYTHNFFYGYTVFPLINPVAWSLEIEIQFYILAPLLVKIFSVKNRTTRRLTIIAAILLSLAAPFYYLPPFRSLYEGLPYFLIGFLLVDFYLDHTPVSINNVAAAVIGLLALSAIWLPNYHPTPDKLHNYFMKVLMVTSIFVLYYLTFFTTVWKKVFSLRLITIIGGMCYSIYLMHYALISMVGRFIVARGFSSNYYIDWLIKAGILSTVILIAGVIYFKLVEQPCMKKDWYKHIFSKKQLAAPEKVPALAEETIR